MNLFDDCLKRLWELLPGEADKRASYLPELAAPEGDKNAILFRDETAFELGGGGKPAACGFLFGDLPPGPDETLLYGRDLSEIESDSPYAHFTVVSLKPEAEETLYAETLKEIAFKGFQTYPAGFHLRVSPSAGREQARVAKAALAQTPPLSFLNVGAGLIRLLKTHPAVERATTVYVTRPDLDHAAFAALARKAKQIANALESAYGMNELDCAACRMKPVCDEIEGLRELHAKRAHG